MEMSDLPEGWCFTKLSEVAEWSSGGTPKTNETKYYNGEIPWAIIRDLNDGIVKSTKSKITELGLKNSSTQIAKKESILIAMYGSIGKLGIAGIDLAMNQAIAFTRDLYNCIERKYLFFILLAKRKELNELGKGGAQQNISQTVLKEVRITLAPINEQKRIVQKLDKLLNKVDDSKERLEKIPLILKRFRQSILNAAVTGELTKDWRERNKVDNTWEEITLDKLVPKGGIFDGPFGSNLKTSDYVSKGVRVIRLENLGHLKFISNKYSFISNTKYQSLKKHTVYENDILFSSFIADEIRACILLKLQEAAIAKADCFCIRPFEEKILRKYLLLQLVSSSSFDQLTKNIHGATRPRINLSQLKKLSLWICSLDEQKEIVKRVEVLFKTADEIETRYKKAKAYVDKLTQSILAKAFRGELVPQDPNDEPAEKLLERIKAEREKQKTLAKSKIQKSKNPR